MFSWENLDNAVVTYNKLISRVAALDPAGGELDQAAFDAMARFIIEQASTPIMASRNW